LAGCAGLSSTILSGNPQLSSDKTCPKAKSVAPVGLAGIKLLFYNYHHFNCHGGYIDPKVQIHNIYQSFLIIDSANPFGFEDDMESYGNYILP